MIKISELLTVRFLSSLICNIDRRLGLTYRLFGVSPQYVYWSGFVLSRHGPQRFVVVTFLFLFLFTYLFI